MVIRIIIGTIIFMLIFGIRDYLKRKNNNNLKPVTEPFEVEISEERISEVKQNLNQSAQEFGENLMRVKESYPFTYWHEELFKESEMEQYTLENCQKAEQIMNNLIDDLIELGLGSEESVKVEVFKKAVLKYNKLNDENGGCIIETGEREDLCKIMDEIAEISGIVPEKYGDGDGIASEWRDW